MSSPDAVSASRAGWHDVILNLAGQLTDDDLAVVRSLLAAGGEDLVARVVRKAIGPGHIELPERPAALLLRLLSASGITDADGLVGIRDEPGLPRFRYSPVSPAGGGSDDPYDGDAHEQAIVAMAPQCGVRELYRAWRYPPVALLEPLRVYLAKADVGADLAGVAGRLQEALSQAGDAAPQVEVYARETELTGYHRNVRSGAETLWLDADPANVRMARLCDGFGARGEPSFAPGHERVSDPSRREQLLRYLISGKVVSAGGIPQDDVVDSSRLGAVPDALRTDGEWIWPEAVAYYLEHYSLAPEPGLAEHIISQGSRVPEPDEAALRNVRAFLIRSF